MKQAIVKGTNTITAAASAEVDGKKLQATDSVIAYGVEIEDLRITDSITGSPVSILAIDRYESTFRHVNIS